MFLHCEQHCEYYLLLRVMVMLSLLCDKSPPTLIFVLYPLFILGDGATSAS